jgi:hypothetical protein
MNEIQIIRITGKVAGVDVDVEIKASPEGYTQFSDIMIDKMIEKMPAFVGKMLDCAPQMIDILVQKMPEIEKAAMALKPPAMNEPKVPSARKRPSTKKKKKRS